MWRSSHEPCASLRTCWKETVSRTSKTNPEVPSEGPRQTGTENGLSGPDMDRRTWGGLIGEGLPTFEIRLRRKRSRWSWSVSTQDGRPIMQGNEATRARASYLANRALFLLLCTCTANPNANSTHKKTSGRKLPAR